jgi:hypothetical protein
MCVIFFDSIKQKQMPLNRWNTFNQALSRRFGTIPVESRSALYRRAQKAASLEPDADGDRLFEYFLASRGERAPIGTSEASSIGSDAPIDDMDDVESLLSEAPVPGRFESPAPSPYRMEAPAPALFEIADTSLHSTLERPDSDATSLVSENYPSVSDELDFRLPGEEPMERTQTMRALLESRGLQAGDLTDDLGRPLGMQSLLRIAQISGIWPLLSDEQKRLFMESDGFLRDGKAYISKRIRTEAPLVRRTLVQLANGTRVAL